MIDRIHIEQLEVHGRVGVLDSERAYAGAPVSITLPPTAPLEFIGSSDDTIAEAVRRALSRASLSLHTLDGVGVIVIPQIERHGAGPRFQVTLRISQAGPAAVMHAPQA